LAAASRESNHIEAKRTHQIPWRRYAAIQGLFLENGIARACGNSQKLIA
jgi:hypothetical protein